MQLSVRLNRLLAEIDGKTCADIGCDHGKLIVCAVKGKKIEHGYAVDISRESLQKAKDLAAENEIEDKIDFLYGDGFLPLPEKQDAIVIAGMGARETVHILSQGDYGKKYILSPHQEAHVLRRFLAENDYFIEKDYYIFDKKYYPIIVAVKGKSNYTDKEYFFGKNTPPDKIFFSYVKRRKAILDKLFKEVGDKLSEEKKKEREEATCILSRT